MCKVEGKPWKNEGEREDERKEHEVKRGKGEESEEKREIEKKMEDEARGKKKTR